MKPGRATTPTRGEVSCDRPADDTLVVRFVGNWTMRAERPVTTAVQQHLEAPHGCGKWPSTPVT